MLIYLVDYVGDGWRVVDKYSINSFAEDSRDEIRVYKAQNRVDLKLKKMNDKRKTDSRQHLSRKKTG